MSKTAVEQRPAHEIWYDTDPFSNMVGAPYIQIDQKLHGIKPFKDISNEYFVDIWNRIRANSYMNESLRNSYFLNNNMREILVGLCTDCKYVFDVEKHPEKHKTITFEEALPPIMAWFDYAIETCRYGKRNERMIDSVSREDIDTFIYNITALCVDTLLIYVQKHNAH